MGARALIRARWWERDDDDRTVYEQIEAHIQREVVTPQMREKWFSDFMDYCVRDGVWPFWRNYNREWPTS